MSTPARDAKGRFVKRGLSEEGKKRAAELAEVTERFARYERRYRGGVLMGRSRRCLVCGLPVMPSREVCTECIVKRRMAAKSCRVQQSWWRKLLRWFGR